MRKISGALNKSKCIGIFINQVREKIGIVFGNPETTPGGRALKFYASVRLEVRRTGSSKQGTEITGNDVKIKVVKNKIAPPFKEALVNIAFGEGISRHAELLILGSDDKFKNADGSDIVDKSGSWYSYDGNKLGQGAENSKQFLKDHPAIADEIERKIRDAHARLIGKDIEKYVPEDDGEEPEEAL